MNVWKILGIDPTEEARKIKRAYSKRIALCHPEDDPEGFQQLQQAYEQALAYARGELDLDDLEELEDVEEAFSFADQLENEMQTDADADADEQAGEGNGERGRSETARGAAPQTAPMPVNAPEPVPASEPQTVPLEGIDWRAQRNVFAGFVPEDSRASRGARKGSSAPDKGPAMMFGAPDEARDEIAARIAERATREKAAREERGTQEEAPEGMGFIRDFLQVESSKEEKRLQKMEFHLEELEQLVESDGDIVSFFNLGIYARYQDIPGFEERLVEILEDYVAQMNIVEMAELQEAIGYDEDGTTPLAVLFNARYESTSPLSFVKGIISFIKKA